MGDHQDFSYWLNTTKNWEKQSYSLFDPGVFGIWNWKFSTKFEKNDSPHITYLAIISTCVIRLKWSMVRWKDNWMGYTKIPMPTYLEHPKNFFWIEKYFPYFDIILYEISKRRYVRMETQLVLDGIVWNFLEIIFMMGRNKLIPIHNFRKYRFLIEKRQFLLFFLWSKEKIRAPHLT